MTQIQIQNLADVLDHADEIVVGTIELGGSLATLLTEFPSKPLRVFHELSPRI